VLISHDEGQVQQGSVASIQYPVVVKGPMREYEATMMTMLGPQGSESGGENPFTKYELKVEFTGPNGLKLVSFGYFAADGRAADTGATQGNQWRAHIVFSNAGKWTWTAQFLAHGKDLNAYPNLNGSFQVKGARNDQRGLLKADGSRYLKYQNGDHWIKVGADSPENLLAYRDFDGTIGTHHYSPHERDATEITSAYTWRNGKGKGLLGGLEYLRSKGVDSIYFLTMNVNGDGNDVWPWTSQHERLRFDCSKLDQWERVFSAAGALGINLHMVLQEEENDMLLDGGWAGNTRKLYYRELIARFGHHSMVINLGEENRNSVQQRLSHIQFIEEVDPYNHPIALHTFFENMYGQIGLDVASVQVWDPSNGKTYDAIAKQVKMSQESGKPWVVMMDENGHWSTGAPPDTHDPDQRKMRSEVLWPTLMAGGGGVEWYFGYTFVHNDLNLEDWRSRDRLWQLSARAAEFFTANVPFESMTPCQQLLANPNDSATAMCLGDDEKTTYLVYLANAESPLSLDLSSVKRGQQLQIKWFHPSGLDNANMHDGTIMTVFGGQNRQIGLPPWYRKHDWAVLIRPDSGIPKEMSVGQESQGVGANKNGGIIYLEPNPSGHVKKVARKKIVVPLACAIAIVVSVATIIASARHYQTLGSGIGDHDGEGAVEKEDGDLEFAECLSAALDLCEGRFQKHGARTTTSPVLAGDACCTDTVARNRSGLLAEVIFPTIEGDWEYDALYDVGGSQAANDVHVNNSTVSETKNRAIDLRQ
jgi:hypothetical protein